MEKSSDARNSDEAISLTGAIALLLELDPGYTAKARWRQTGCYNGRGVLGYYMAKITKQ